MSKPRVRHPCKVLPVPRFVESRPKVQGCRYCPKNSSVLFEFVLGAALYLLSLGQPRSDTEWHCRLDRSTFPLTLIALLPFVLQFGLCCSSSALHVSTFCKHNETYTLAVIKIRLDCQSPLRTAFQGIQEQECQRAANRPSHSMRKRGYFFVVAIVVVVAHDGFP